MTGAMVSIRFDVHYKHSQRNERRCHFDDQRQGDSDRDGIPRDLGLPRRRWQEQAYHDALMPEPTAVEEDGIDPRLVGSEIE